MTRTRTPALVLALCAVLAVLCAAPAQAAGYRYWSFWQGGDGGTWTYATQGPATARPADGEVSGFRFGVSTGTQDTARPRRAPDFTALCGTTPAKAGTKRVGVVVDFGTRADAPDGGEPPALRAACARVRTDASAAEALAAVATPLRYNDDALLCAIAGHPRTGCGEQVSSGARPSPGTGKDAGSGEETGTGKETGSGAAGGDGGSGPSVGTVAGGAAVLVLGAAAVWRARRRRR